MMKHILFPLALLMFLSLGAGAQENPSGAVGIHEYYAALAISDPSDNHTRLSKLTDSELVHTKMTVEQMAEFMGSTLFQTKMVYFYSRLTSKDESPSMMTPCEFVHSLADDLFGRKSLQGLVSKRQKEGLFLRRDLMDWADQGIELPAEKLAELAVSFDNYTF